MKKLFGTDGVRGVANIHPMTTETAMHLGRAAAYIFKSSHGRRHRIVIGKDTRLSGYMLESALVAGICSMGVDVLLVGPLPTPGIANITRTMRADAGVVISASHNPFQDNGIKFFSADGFKLPDDIEKEIENLIGCDHLASLRPTAREVGKAYRIDDAAGRYIVFLKNTFPADLDLSGMKIVLDCANGAAYKVAPAVFEELGAEVILLGATPNGTNINAGCGSLHPEVISKAVKANAADIGIALDGDADRVIVCDEYGNEVNGDQIMAICATDMLARNQLNHKTLVATVMSNMGLDIALRRAGGSIVKTAVGDRYVVEEMRRGGYNLGGEQSGHLIFLDCSTTGDGVLAALQLLAIVRRTQKPLSELAGVMTSLPQVLVNVRVKQRTDIMSIPSIATAIGGVEEKLGSNGRVLIRYSGTEPLLRIMLEGPDNGEITAWANEIAELVKNEIGE
ncbi:phosphoglucosamine mutase [Trichlorobacter ammonificans]|uniref:Phosphoglucosamine mutase n=1 Tax=Trichlorobacter ammonificans TaxID=2916410 RepID=A0ABM9DB01_9BACT|nr:phosphoglucosamine mutase [Trichlorobacter ammonificans]CAH2031567.1 phosphoglucosamine mutase [Trichlorobacter ammonificans]